MNKNKSHECLAFSLGREWLKTIPRKIETTPLFGDASGRAYSSVDFGNSTAVLMQIAAVDSPEFGRGDAYFDFADMRDFLDSMGIAVPKVYARDDEQRAMLLENLGDTTLYDAIARTPSQKMKLLKETLDTLIVWQKSMTVRHDFSSPADKKTFRKSLMMTEFYHFYEYMIYKRVYHLSTDGLWQKLEKHFKKISNRLSRMPYMLSHRDFQSRNLMFHDNRWVVIDFQDALLAPVLYDLVALLRDSYLSLEQKELDELLNYFWENSEVIRELLVDKEEYLTLFHLMTLQRKLKDAGRFVYLHQVKEKEWFMQFVAPTLVTINSSLDYLGLTALKKLLAAYIPEFQKGDGR